LSLKDYLERISYRDEIAPNLDVLAGLLSHHVRSIPFENIDVQLGMPLTTNPTDAFEKIVLRRRGGWCYEQNGLFGWALREVGFHVTRVAAAVMRAGRGSIAEANHLCLLVLLEDTGTTYLVDVGFGGSMVAPIPLEPSDHHQAPFRLGLRQTDDDHWQFWEDVGKGEFSFDFRAQVADEDALSSKCEFLQTDPASSFVQNLVAQIRLPNAHKTLRGKVFSHATANGIETREIVSADELRSLLLTVFNLDVPEVAGLWPKIEARHEAFLREQELTDTYDMRTRSNSEPLPD
jgi:N-hydroxyarylamine O-acetyltransferase